MPNWVMKMALDGEEHCSHMLYRDDELGVQMEIVTPRKANGDFGRQTRYFFIDGDEATYPTEKSMMEALEIRLKQRAEKEATE